MLRLNQESTTKKGYNSTAFLSFSKYYHSLCCHERLVSEIAASTRARCMCGGWRDKDYSFSDGYSVR
jgi:hypothetical protein